MRTPAEGPVVLGVSLALEDSTSGAASSLLFVIALFGLSAAFWADAGSLGVEAGAASSSFFFAPSVFFGAGNAGSGNAGSLPEDAASPELFSFSFASDMVVESWKWFRLRHSVRWMM